MALVKYGGGIVQMSGSIAGNTFARNRYGNYVRSKTVPVNPNTARQQVIRAAITQLTTRWKETLTAAQRTAWQLYADSVNMTNRLGEVMNLSGFNHYIRSNSILAQQGITLIDAGPTDFTLPEADATFALTASEATQLATITFDDTLDWCDLDEAYMFVFCGRPRSVTRNFFDGPYRYMDNIAGDSGTPPTSTETMTTPFVVTEGQVITCYARIALPDGRITAPFRGSIAVAA